MEAGAQMQPPPCFVPVYSPILAHTTPRPGASPTRTPALPHAGWKTEWKVGVAVGRRRHASRRACDREGQPGRQTRRQRAVTGPNPRRMAAPGSGWGWCGPLDTQLKVRAPGPWQHCQQQFSIGGANFDPHQQLAPHLSNHPTWVASNLGPLFIQNVSQTCALCAGHKLQGTNSLLIAAIRRALLPSPWCQCTQPGPYHMALISLSLPNMRVCNVEERLLGRLAWGRFCNGLCSAKRGPYSLLGVLTPAILLCPSAVYVYVLEPRGRPASLHNAAAPKRGGGKGFTPRGSS
jgi:hypothetical protein